MPSEETGPVPVHVTTAPPRFFGVTPPGAVLALAAASFALALVLLVSGHVVVGGVLMGVALLLFLLLADLVRRLPDTAVAKVSAKALGVIKTRAGLVLEATSVHSGARVELFRLRRELLDLATQRMEWARTLGEAVYAGDNEASAAAREKMAELDGLIAAKEDEMEQTATEAMKRIQRAQLQVQPTMIETPEPPPMPSPEPYPSPTEPPAPVPIPEPTPEPSEPPGPVRVPEPGPEPSPPATPQG
ncbi:MAG: hypothetical protein WBB76_01745 [Gaiellaceae bacterium]